MKKLTLVAVVLSAIANVVWVRQAYSHNPVVTTVLFNREIATLFNAKCAQCHVEDGMAMALQTHAQARPWAIAIKEEVLARRMPPWPAERGYGAFANDAGLTPRELEFLISWIDGGTPEGEGEPPQPVDHSGHWMLGQPDGTYTAAPAAGASSASATRYIVDPGFAKETWIRAIDLKMPDKRAARAAFLSVADTGEYLGGWTPWYTSVDFPAGAAFRLPAGARLAVDVLHGDAAIAGPPRVGLYVSDGTKQPLGAMKLMAQGPAGQRRLHVKESLPAARTIVGLRVEMSPGGTSIEVRARRPDGVFVPLVWIKNFRQDWQTPFVLNTPVALPAGSILQATSYFEPSSSTPPHATVHLVGYPPAAGTANAAPPAPPAHVH